MVVFGVDDCNVKTEPSKFLRYSPVSFR